MKVRHLWDGEAFSLYALEIGDEHDCWSFRATMRREQTYRAGEQAPASTKEVDVTDNPIEHLPDGVPDFEDDLRWARRQPAYWAEKLKLDVADGIAAELERQQVSRAELARRMGTSAPFITKILRGHHNWSLETLAKAGAALGQQWLLVSAPMDATARVFTRLEFRGVRGVIGGSVDEEGLLEGDWSPAAGGTADSTAAEREEQDDENVFVAA